VFFANQCETSIAGFLNQPIPPFTRWDIPHGKWTPIFLKSGEKPVMYEDII